MASIRSSVEPKVSSTEQATGQTYRGSFAIMTILFFMWGFMTVWNDVLIPRFKEAFTLTFFQAMLVQFAFFGAYGVGSLIYYIISMTSGDPINRIGYISRTFLRHWYRVIYTGRGTQTRVVHKQVWTGGQDQIGEHQPVRPAGGRRRILNPMLRPGGCCIPPTVHETYSGKPGRCPGAAEPVETRRPQGFQFHKPLLG
jgi:hypothetical protein